MSSIVERYRAIPMADNATATSTTSNSIGGFLAVTAGTITVVQNGNPNTGTQNVILVNALPVTAGTYTRLPFLTMGGFTVTLAGGASGTLAAT